MWQPCCWLVVLSFAIAGALYQRLPQAVPTHWNAHGVADGFSPKPWGPFLLPLTMAGMLVLFSVLPRISPRGYGIERFQRAFEVMQAAILALMLLVTTLALLGGAGLSVPLQREAIPAGVGLLFVVLGNFMGKVTKNFFVGIRTPWALANDEVWLRTHRLGGKLFVLAGIGLFVSGLLGGGPLFVVAAVAVAAGVPAVYSYVLYRRIEGLGRGS